jgi:hypothetical protein
MAELAVWTLNGPRVLMASPPKYTPRIFPFGTTSLTTSPVWMPWIDLDHMR